MKCGKNDTECQTSIQGMSLSDFCDYLRNREGSFKIFCECYTLNTEHSIKTKSPQNQYSIFNVIQHM